jgi:hypothetical protein
VNGIITRASGQSVQLAVMAAPQRSVLEAVSEARRRTGDDDRQDRVARRTIFLAASASA